MKILNKIIESNDIQYLYHSSNNKIPVGSKLKTPTGNSELNVLSGGVVYLTKTVNACKRYGKYIYKVKVKDPILYKEQRKKQNLPKKKPKYIKDVYIALPENTEVVAQIK